MAFHVTEPAMLLLLLCQVHNDNEQERGDREGLQLQAMCGTGKTFDAAVPWLEVPALQLPLWSSLPFSPRQEPCSGGCTTSLTTQCHPGCQMEASGMNPNLCHRRYLSVAFVLPGLPSTLCSTLL